MIICGVKAELSSLFAQTKLMPLRYKHYFPPWKKTEEGVDGKEEERKKRML